MCQLRTVHHTHFGQLIEGHIDSSNGILRIDNGRRGGQYFTHYK